MSAAARTIIPAEPVQLPPALRATLDEGLNALAAIGAVVRFERNATIFSDGDDADYAYRIVSGTVRLCKLMSDGRRQIAEFRGAGDLLGFEWLDTHAFSAEALTDAVAVRYARSRLDRLGEERGDVRRSLMAVLSRDLWAAQNHLVILGRQSARERVVSFLLALAERSGTANGGTIDVPMGRQDIADYLGLTIETVCRTVSDLKRKRLIAVPNRTQIKLCDLEKLHEIAEGDL
jgi:CRP-like cAMP-binding protein